MPKPFQKGPDSRRNLSGCPEGAHHIGRPASKVKQLAKRRSLAIIKRMANIADGKNLEQVVNENGESIRVPAPVREQINAGKVVLTVARELGADIEIDDDKNGHLTVKVIRYG